MQQLSDRAFHRMYERDSQVAELHRKNPHNRNISGLGASHHVWKQVLYPTHSESCEESIVDALPVETHPEEHSTTQNIHRQSPSLSTSDRAVLSRVAPRDTLQRGSKSLSVRVDLGQ